MSDSDYTEVEAESNIGKGSPDFYFKAEGRTNDELVYAFYKDEDAIPDYMIEHAKRNVEAEEIEENVKLGRMVDTHMTDNPDKDWRTLE